MNALKEKIIAGDEAGTAAIVRSLLDNKVEIEIIMKQGLIAAMDEVGDRFQAGRIYLPEMLVAAQAMKSGLAVLEPLIKGSGVKPVGTAVIGTMRGDLHDIGKNLVIISLEGAGFEVVDLGMDVPPEKFVDAIGTHRPRVVGMSALLSTTMSGMEKTIAAIEAAGLRDQVKIMVGGAPVNQDFADRIGADFYGKDSVAAKVFAVQTLKK
jgi:5-methyltetrahydrofolate--homocysteine methyltransferase